MPLEDFELQAQQLEEERAARQMARVQGTVTKEARAQSLNGEYDTAVANMPDLHDRIRDLLRLKDTLASHDQPMDDVTYDDLIHEIKRTDGEVPRELARERRELRKEIKEIRAEAVADNADLETLAVIDQAAQTIDAARSSEKYKKIAEVTQERIKKSSEKVAEQKAMIVAADEKRVTAAEQLAKTKITKEFVANSWKGLDIWCNRWDRSNGDLYNLTGSIRTGVDKKKTEQGLSDFIHSVESAFSEYFRRDQNDRWKNLIERAERELEDSAAKVAFYKENILRCERSVPKGWFWKTIEVFDLEKFPNGMLHTEVVSNEYAYTPSGPRTMPQIDVHPQDIPGLITLYQKKMEEELHTLKQRIAKVRAVGQGMLDEAVTSVKKRKESLRFEIPTLQSDGNQSQLKERIKNLQQKNEDNDKFWYLVIGELQKRTDAVYGDEASLKHYLDSIARITEGNISYGKEWTGQYNNSRNGVVREMKIRESGSRFTSFNFGASVKKDLGREVLRVLKEDDSVTSAQQQK